MKMHLKMNNARHKIRFHLEGFYTPGHTMIKVYILIFVIPIYSYQS